MIHIFRLYSNKKCDFLEFVDKTDVVDVFKQERNPMQYDWRTMPIKQALKEEESLLKHGSLLKMQQRGDKAVIRVILKGECSWYSPSAQYTQGIPSFYRVAISFFTDPAKEFKVTTQHHEIFEVIRDERFSSLSRQLFYSILKRVKSSRCERRLDQYVDYNLKKLKEYGVNLPSVKGTYIQIKQQVANEDISCPFYSDFFHQLLDVCIEKEKELLGENRTYVKYI